MVAYELVQVKRRRLPVAPLVSASRSQDTIPANETSVELSRKAIATGWSSWCFLLIFLRVLERL
jgi:hypothetical protein